MPSRLVTFHMDEQFLSFYMTALGAAVTDRDGMNLGAVGAEMTVDRPAATEPSTMTTSSYAGNSDPETTVDLPAATEPSTTTQHK